MVFLYNFSHVGGWSRLCGMELSTTVVVQCYDHMPIFPIWACPWANYITDQITGCQIRIFPRESNGFPKLHRLVVRKKFGGFMLCLDVLAPHFQGETRIPKCISSGYPLKKMGCTDPQLPLIWQPEIMGQFGMHLSLKQPQQFHPNEDNLYKLNVHLCIGMILLTWAQ